MRNGLHTRIDCDVRNVVGRQIASVIDRLNAKELRTDSLELTTVHNNNVRTAIDE